MNPPTSRLDMLTFFDESQLMIYSHEEVQFIEDEEAKDILTNVGLPNWPVMGFDFSESPEGRLQLVRDWENLYQYIERGTGFLPTKVADWPVLATYFPSVDHLLLDPRSGTVHVVRHGSEDFYPLHSSLRTYIHFLLILKKEAPMTPDNDFEDFFELDTDAIRRRIQQQWREVDPFALRKRSSIWYELLLVMHEPEAYHYSCAEDFPYPFFEEGIIREYANNIREDP